MNVTFLCAKCEKATRLELDSTSRSVACGHCGAIRSLRSPRVDGSGDGSSQIEPAEPAERVERCMLCPSDEMYVRKDFNQRLGIAIIVVGFVASSITWANHQVVATFAILIASALFDAFLWMITPNVLQCYRCHSEYRRIEGLDDHAPFDLEVHEKYRQEAARLAESEREAALRRRASDGDAEAAGPPADRKSSVGQEV